MEQHRISDSHVGFLRRSSVYIAISVLTSVFELGITWISKRLPGEGFSTFWPLLRLFFIVTVPLAGVQLVVSKEVAAYGVLNASGRRRTFVTNTFRVLVIAAFVIVAVGLLVAPLISSFLKLDSVTPVRLIFILIAVYFPLSFVYGTIQGLKRFYWLGLSQMGWGLFRFLFAIAAVLLLGGGLNALLVAVILGTIVTVVLSAVAIRDVFTCPSEPIDRDDLLRGYRFVVPVVIMLFAINVMKGIDLMFAKRYLDAAAAEAYTTAAQVGMAFFIFSGIFIVMFPMVSEENTRGGNPVMFLFKSCGFIATFSLIGLLIAWIRPDIPMNIITLGISVPGAEPLIRLVGLAVVPVALVYVIANYLLAKHSARFLPLLLAGMILQIVMIMLRHGTPMELLTSIIIANWITFAALVAAVIVDHRHTVLSRTS
jgi:O-antigen/teichoic acid export membrane protein